MQDGGRGHSIDGPARAVRQGRAEQRMFAVDALVADPRHLLGQPLDQPVVDLRRRRGHPQPVEHPPYDAEGVRKASRPAASQ